MSDGCLMTRPLQLYGSACHPFTLALSARPRNTMPPGQPDCLFLPSQDYRFVLAIHMMCDVLPHLTALSCAMQERDAVYVTIKPLVN